MTDKEVFKWLFRTGLLLLVGLVLLIIFKLVS